MVISLTIGRCNAISPRGQGEVIGTRISIMPDWDTPNHHQCISWAANSTYIYPSGSHLVHKLDPDSVISVQTMPWNLLAHQVKCSMQNQTFFLPKIYRNHAQSRVLNITLKITTQFLINILFISLNWALDFKWQWFATVQVICIYVGYIWSNFSKLIHTWIKLHTNIWRAPDITYHIDVNLQTFLTHRGHYACFSTFSTPFWHWLKQ